AITGTADVPATVMDNNSASNALRIFFIILLLSKFQLFITPVSLFMFMVAFSMLCVKKVKA
ncbi:MAG: hypothetical protein SPL82_16620, partial [Lachnospiraceae bacterium]|nr:hypothetical protein [Lachnospiraceae bacterium]